VLSFNPDYALELRNELKNHNPPAGQAGKIRRFGRCSKHRSGESENASKALIWQ